MKTLTALLLLPFFSYSQLFVSTEVDPKNAIFGSEVNPPAYNGTFSIGARAQNFQAQLSYEQFMEIGFQSLEVRAGKVFNEFRNFNYVLSGGLSWIYREVEWLQKVLFISASLHGQVEYHFEGVFFTARSEARFRGDLERVVYSGYVGIGINLFE